MTTEDLLACVHCGLCLSSCPTYLENGNEADSPRGRILLMRALEEGRLRPTADVTSHLDACLGCRACETACPSGVRYGSLIEAARPLVERHRPRGPRLIRRLLDSVLTRPTLRNAATAPLRLLAGKPWTSSLARRTAWPLLGYAAALPEWRGAMVLPSVVEPEGPRRGTAVLLTGCVAHTSFPRTTLATARLLARAGVRVEIPRRQGCCGALSLHLGDDARARDLALALTREAPRDSADWYVTTAAGCGAHLRAYAHLLPDDPAAAELAARARDPLDVLAEIGLPPPPSPLERRIAVHDPCHLAHGQGVRDAPRRLLAQIPGVELVPLAESDHCCGSAGTYNLTEPEMAARLRDRKLRNIVASGAEIIATANPGCLLQIRSGAILEDLRVEIAHPIDILARAHGVGGP